MNIILLIDSIKTRPLFFLNNYSIYDFDAFIRGYGYYRFAHEIEDTEQDDYFNDFKNNWLKRKLNIERNAPYIQYLMLISDNPADALDNFFELWALFVDENKLRK